jgi:hypothetical protein
MHLSDVVHIQLDFISRRNLYFMNNDDKLLISLFFYRIKLSATFSQGARECCIVSTPLSSVYFFICDAVNVVVTYVHTSLGVLPLVLYLGEKVCLSSTTAGFEPTREFPSGFLVHHLNHSVK